MYTVDSQSDLAPKWADLLKQAVTQPGVVSQCYSQFWNYSLGNQLLAMFQ